jgi:hypothetical protein
METGQWLVDRMPSKIRTMAFISTQERYSHVLLSISICFPQCMTPVLHNWSISFSFKVRGSSTPRVVVWVCSWWCPCIGFTAAQQPPLLASTTTLLIVGGLNPSVEGAILLMIRQAWLADPMWGRGDVPQLHHQGERTAHLINRHSWLIIILIRAKERYWQPCNYNSKVQMYRPVFFVVHMHYYFCFLVISSTSRKSIAFYFFHISLVGYVGGNRARRVDADTTAPWVLSLPSLSSAGSLLLLARGKETLRLNGTIKETEKYSADRRPKDQQAPSVLSSHYSVSVSLQGAHYL